MATPPNPAATDTDDTWAIVELLGHRQVAGRIREVQRYGTVMLRVDVPELDGQPATTHYYSGNSIYGEHPVTEEVARRAAESMRHTPVHRWAAELPAAPQGRYEDPWEGLPDDHFDDDLDDEDEGAATP